MLPPKGGPRLPQRLLVATGVPWPWLHHSHLCLNLTWSPHLCVCLGSSPPYGDTGHRAGHPAATTSRLHLIPLVPDKVTLQAPGLGLERTLQGARSHASELLSSSPPTVGGSLGAHPRIIKTAHHEQPALCESVAHASFPPGLSAACGSGGVFPRLITSLSVLSFLDRRSSHDRCRNDHNAGAQPQT